MFFMRWHHLNPCHNFAIETKKTHAGLLMFAFYGFRWQYKIDNMTACIYEICTLKAVTLALVCLVCYHQLTAPGLPFKSYLQHLNSLTSTSRYKTFKWNMKIYVSVIWFESMFCKKSMLYLQLPEEYIEEKQHRGVAIKSHLNLSGIFTGKLGNWGKHWNICWVYTIQKRKSKSSWVWPFDRHYFQ